MTQSYQQIKKFISKKLFSKYLWITNTFLCGVLLGSADLVQQRLEIYVGEKEHIQFERFSKYNRSKITYCYIHDIHLKLGCLEVRINFFCTFFLDFDYYQNQKSV